MIRFIRGLIYGLAGGMTTAILLDHMAEGRRARLTLSNGLADGVNGAANGAENANSSAGESVRRSFRAVEDTSENLSDEARQALLDELGAQL